MAPPNAKTYVLLASNASGSNVSSTAFPRTLHSGLRCNGGETTSCWFALRSTTYSSNSMVTCSGRRLTDSDGGSTRTGTGGVSSLGPPVGADT